MKITDTQQAAQYSASAAVSAAEAKQYLLSIEQPIIDIEGSVSDAKDAAILSRQAMEEAKAISSGLSESIDFEIAAKEAEFESQMQDQRSNFESAQQAKENDFISSQTQMESEFEASQANKESRFQEFLDSSGYVFLGDYENGPFQFNARNQYIRYNNQYYRLNAATDVGFITTGTTAASFANDVTHFVLMDGDTLRQNLASSDGFKWVGQFPSVGSLAATSGSHGDRVLVRSYHEGGSEGGGQFVYDDARGDENDGVTVFNGWVRQIVNNTLTNYDAGIIPFDGSDATSRLSALFNNAPDGTHLYIIGHHQISGPVTIKGKNALTFHSDYGAISGYERRESWVWGADSDFEYGSGNLGILSFFNCHKIIVDGLFIDGAHLQRPDSKEWGDCMVRYEHCTYMTIRNCKGDGFGGWGIFGLYSDYADIHKNVISRVSRQSGINAFACSSYSKVYNNTLNDVGLYGVEFETFDSKADSVTYGNQAYNNEIRGAKFGLTVVGNHNDALIYSNKCYGCQTGVFAIKYTGKNIVIRDNSILDCMRGVQVNASKNVLTLRNTLTVNEVPAFV
ncbi:right-handed parallel beta-helix repeat-containing protein, partial [Klebsiella michiganensis]